MRRTTTTNNNTLPLHYHDDDTKKSNTRTRVSLPLLLCAVCSVMMVSLFLVAILHGRGAVVYDDDDDTIDASEDDTTTRTHITRSLGSTTAQQQQQQIRANPSTGQCLPGFVEQPLDTAYHHSWVQSLWTRVTPVNNERQDSTVSQPQRRREPNKRSHCVRQVFFPRAFDTHLLDNITHPCDDPHQYACGAWLDAVDAINEHSVTTTQTLDDLSAEGAHTQLAEVYTDAINDQDSVLFAFEQMCRKLTGTTRMHVSMPRDDPVHQALSELDATTTTTLDALFRSLYASNVFTAFAPLDADRWLVTVCGLDTRRVLALRSLVAWWPHYDSTQWTALCNALVHVQSALCTPRHTRTHVSHFVETGIPQVDTWWQQPLSLEYITQHANRADLLAVTRLCIVLTGAVSMQLGVDPLTSGGGATATTPTHIVRVRVALSRDVYSAVHCRRLALVTHVSVLQDRYLMYAVGRVARAALRNTINLLEVCMNAPPSNSVTHIKLVESTRDERTQLANCIRSRRADDHHRDTNAALLAAVQCSSALRWRRNDSALFEVHQAEALAERRDDGTTYVLITPGLLRAPWFSVEFSLDTVLARLGLIVLHTAMQARTDSTTTATQCSTQAQRDTLVLATLERCFAGTVAQREFWIDALQLWCTRSKHTWRLGNAIGTHALTNDDTLRTEPLQCYDTRGTGARLNAAMRNSAAFRKAFECK